MYPPVDDVLDRLKRFGDECRARGVLVGCIQNVISDESALGAWRRHFGERWATPSPLAPHQPGVQFQPGFEPQSGDLVLAKPRYSAFYGTPLASILRSRGTRAVIVGGLTTDVCVSGTARECAKSQAATPITQPLIPLKRRFRSGSSARTQRPGKLRQRWAQPCLLNARSGPVMAASYLFALGLLLALRCPRRMCRSIKTLANFEPPATDDEIRAAAVQFVRKLSGTARPSRANEATFDRAVD